MTVSPPPTDTDRLVQALWGVLGVERHGITAGPARVWTAPVPPDRVLATLAPVVEEIAARRAAEALTEAAAAASLIARHVTAGDVIRWLDDRAAALVAAHPDQEQQR